MTELMVDVTIAEDEGEVELIQAFLRYKYPQAHCVYRNEKIIIKGDDTVMIEGAVNDTRRLIELTLPNPPLMRDYREKPSN